MKQIHRYIVQALHVLVFLFLLTVSGYAGPVYCCYSAAKIAPTESITYAKPVGLQNSTLLNLQTNPAVPGVDFKSVYSFGSDAVTQIGKMVNDEFGNSYITGAFTGTLILGPDTLVSTAGYDFYITKIDANNNPVWARMAHGITTENEDLSLDGGTVIVIDSQGNLYAGGGFVKSLTFLDADGEPVAELNDGRDDDLLNLELFIVKYDNDGNLLWTLGGNSGSTGGVNTLTMGINSVNDIVLDPEDYPYIVGRFSGTTFMDIEVDIVGKSDAYLASLDKDGSELYWVSTTGTPGDDIAMSASVDQLGYINVLGTIAPGVMILPDSNNDITWENDSGFDDTFIISYDVNGEWYFASFLGAGEQIVGNDIATSDGGDFFVTGYFSDYVSFVGPNDIELDMQGEFVDGFIAKYDIDGDALWAIQFSGVVAEGQRIILDDLDNVYVLGVYRERVVFGADTDAPVELNTDSESQIFIAKYDTEGNFEWAKQIDGEGQEGVAAAFMNSEAFPFSVNPLDIQLSKNIENEILISGDFDTSIKLDDLQISSPTGARLGFVASLDVSGQTVSITPRAGSTLPSAFELSQNYPNPFNPTTMIGFALPESGEVKLEVYDMTGRRVRTLVNESRVAGYHEIAFDASQLASGIYTYNLKAGNTIITRKLTLVK
jgi:hypothetical protein